MEHRQFSNKIEDFTQFLTEFCEEIKDESETDDCVPVRQTNPRITPLELEGECLEWCRDFLSTRGCPIGFSGLLTHEVYRQVTSVSLDSFYTEDVRNASPRIETDRDETCEEINKRKIESDKEEIGCLYKRNITNTFRDGRDDFDVVVWTIKVGQHNRLLTKYSAERLRPHVISVLETVCRTWLANSPELQMDGSLPVISFYAIKNTRRKMEDKHTIVPDLNALFGLKDHPPQSFYAVFDGHAGTEAALFTSKHLHCNLVHHCQLGNDPAGASKAAFKTTDEQFITKAKRERWKSGSTGVTALLRGNNLYLSWLGDSQAVLVKNGRAVTTMKPHKPDRQDERDRVNGQGGFVMLIGDMWRVGGNLAVSRAIGDIGYKPFISSEAEVLEIEFDGTEDYMVLACDGLWDVVSEEELPNLVYNFLQQNNHDRQAVAEHLVQYAKDNESMDNISVIVVFFRETVPKPVAGAGFFDFSAGDSQGSNESGASGDRHSKGDQSGSTDGTGDNSSEQQQLDDRYGDYPQGQHRQGDRSSERPSDVDESEGNSENTESVDGSQSSDMINNETNLAEISGLGLNDLSRAEIARDIYREGEGEYRDYNAQIMKDSSGLSSYVSEQGEINQKENTLGSCKEDLDYYGVFNTRLIDGPIDLSFIDDQNSSYLLKNIADSVYNKHSRRQPRPYDYGVQPCDHGVPPYDHGVRKDEKLVHLRGLQEEGLGSVSHGNFGPQKTMKKVKKVKTEVARMRRDPRRKGTGTSPICWAFAGKNQATVQNHRLNMAAKSRKITDPTPGELTLAQKAPTTRHAKISMNKLAQAFSSTGNVHGIANMTLSHRKLESLPPPRTKVSSTSLSNMSAFTVFGSKASLQTESQKFHITLRPRKPLKPISTVVYETPPTPFVSNKLHMARQ